jgi:hypothetical protein
VYASLLNFLLLSVFYLPVLTLYKYTVVERRVKPLTHSEAREMLNRVNRLMFLMGSVFSPPKSFRSVKVSAILLSNRQ